MTRAAALPRQGTWNRRIHTVGSREPVAEFDYTAHVADSVPMPSPVAFNFEPPPRFLTQDEVSRFFDVIGDPRDRALFAVVYLYGLRVSEAVALRRKDVDLAARRILIRRSKRGIWGIRPLFGSVRPLLATYLAERSSDETTEEPLFAGRQGPLRRRRIQQLFTLYAEAAHLPQNATCHSLRHAIATHLLDAGESLEFVKEHLGHKKIENTAIYARVSNPARDRAFARLERSRAIVHLNAPPATSTQSEQE